MSSNNREKQSTIGRVINKNLYRRITLSFTSLFFFAVLIAMTAILVFSSLLLNEFTKNKFKSAVVHMAGQLEQDEVFAALDGSEYIEYIYESYIVPLGTTTNLSVKVDNGIQSASNNNAFDTLLWHSEKSPGFDGYKNGAYPDPLVVKFTYEQNTYQYLSFDMRIAGKFFTLSAFVNIQDIYYYTKILTLLTACAFVVVFVITISSSRLIMKRTLLPLNSIAQTVKTISEENLGVTMLTGKSKNPVDNLIMELNEMLKRLNFAFEHQKRFISDASHELRIPLTIVQGYLDIIRTWGRRDDKLLDESAEAISEEVNNMKVLVDKLLLLHNLDSGSYQFSVGSIELNQFIQKIAQDTTMLTINHTVMEQHSKRPMYVNADDALLQSAVRTLIDNSVKYTQPGGVIRLIAQDKADFANIVIWDNGCGIPQDQLEKVKTRFYRTDSARTKTAGGHGLGISIALSSLEAMGGSLKIESEEGKWTKVTVALPKKNT